MSTAVRWVAWRTLEAVWGTYAGERYPIPAQAQANGTARPIAAGSQIRKH